MKPIEKMTVKECAKVLGISQQKCRQGIIQKVLPFGVCIRSENENEKNTFIIPKERFEEWLKGGF